VDLRKGESFGFLGFEFRCVRSLKGRWRPQYTPKLKKRTALLAKLREVFRRKASQPGSEVRLGGKENPASCDAGTQTKGFWLETMEYGVALPNARAVSRLSHALLRAIPESRSGTIGLITLNAEVNRKAECSKWACSV
jgi:hypothetical protein